MKATSGRCAAIRRASITSLLPRAERWPGELKGLAEPALGLTSPAQASETDDDLLTASEISRLKMNADWVVLSACNTAVSVGLAAGTLGNPPAVPPTARETHPGAADRHTATGSFAPPGWRAARLPFLRI